MAKLCLSVCGCTSFRIPARLAASLQAFQTVFCIDRLITAMEAIAWK